MYHPKNTPLLCAILAMTISMPSVTFANAPRTSATKAQTSVPATPQTAVPVATSPEAPSSATLEAVMRAAPTLQTQPLLPNLASARTPESVQSMSSVCGFVVWMFTLGTATDFAYHACYK
jgi:hypothetical protein